MASLAAAPAGAEAGAPQRGKPAVNGWVPEAFWGAGTAVLFAAFIYGNYREEEEARRQKHEV